MLEGRVVDLMASGIDPWHALRPRFMIAVKRMHGYARVTFPTKSYQFNLEESRLEKQSDKKLDGTSRLFRRQQGEVTMTGVAGQQPELRWSVERRLEFIEFRLYWEGRVNRGDIVDTFGVSVNQSSTDINRYIGMAPDNLAYDKSARTYVRTDAFRPKFLKPSATGYLSQLRSLVDGVIEMTDAWVGVVPDFDATPTPVRGVNSATLREVISAIRHKETIKVKYQSLSQPEPKWRWIAPHAIAFDGFRWHARAWCEESESFKDFLLSRMLETRAHRRASCDATSDADWNDYVTVEIGPHPELSQTQKDVIALDYGMHDGKVEIKTRKALLYYTLKRLGLDTDPAARAPQDQQIVLLGTTEQRKSSPPDVAGGAIQ